jgi:hypothetical protein
MTDLLVAGGRRAREFQPVQRRLAGCRRTVVAPGLEFARQHRHHRIMAEVVVIVQVLVAERNPEHPLPDERGDRVLDESRVSRVAETSGKPPNENQASIRGAQQQAPRVRSQRAATGRPSTGPNTLGSEPHSVCILFRIGSSRVVKQLLPDRRPDALSIVRNAG